MTGERERPEPPDESEALRAVALRNADAIAQARQRAEEALQARTLELSHSLSLMQATLESTADGLLVTRRDGQVLTFNTRFLLMWQLDRDSVAEQPHAAVMERVWPRLRAPADAAQRLAQIIAAPAPETLDILELIDGRVIERFSRPQVVGAQVEGRVWSYRDVTVRERAERAAREEARVLDALNRTGASIASTLELTTLLQTVTDAATQLSGAEFGAFFCDTTDASGDACLQFTLSGAPREAFEEFGLPSAMPLFGPPFGLDAPVRMADVLQDPRYAQWAPHHGMPTGHLAVRSYLAVPVTSPSGQTVGGLFFGHSRAGVFDERAQRVVVGIAAQASIAIENARLYEQTRRIAAERERVIDAERAARADMARVDRLKDEFLATLSHELRTPLTAILGWAKVLLRKKGETDVLARGLETIERNAVAQAKLIEDLLDMNRIISGKVRLDVQPIDLARVVEAAVDALRPSAEGRKLRLDVVLEPAAGAVAGDPDRLQQVVWNLLTNAVKFTPPGGSIEVRLQRVGAAVELCISDSGVGIAAEFLPHVFDRFRQADSSITRGHGGLGLGLSIVKQLVELHGGTIAATSDGEGRGASFIVSLPLTAAPTTAEQDAIERAHPGVRPKAPLPAADVDLQGLTVLVVDDEPDARALIRQLLEDGHAAVHTAGSVDEALGTLARVRPDLLLSDIGMPGRDGYDLIRAVRRLPPEGGGRTPAIALTAFARSEDGARALLAGFQVHIAKPIEPDELLATVASLARRPEAAGV